MFLDVVDLRNFYGGPLGGLVRKMLRAKLAEMWPKVGGDRVLGIGYATPLLRPFIGRAERVIGFMPARQGVVNWPWEGPSATALIDETALPLPDSSVDRVLLVHTLEMADDPSEVLREIWRVMAPGGRLICVVPNRIGLWARLETTPFGYGLPFSQGQLDSLLKTTLFSPIDWRGALYMLPSSRPFAIRMAGALERFGARTWPTLAGVLVVEATKQLYQGLPARSGNRLRAAPIFRPALIRVAEDEAPELGHGRPT
ncbi:class I SAM-dependent methyltransferase [Siculibacillus lacustris]|uniref:Class I SAM-dependent methyltransferase n=1 Tax=Siculibacillus lacustris TaxID=1549641 RepID=A0A4Q9VXB3_9HYPH|nr:methyltransferase domain-containing protein [Siculibacillus lacustris]TBW39957.1 class I SAM-dependent methyltransferase [Siculibacillus lacustris]